MSGHLARMLWCAQRSVGLVSSTNIVSSLSSPRWIPNFTTALADSEVFGLNWRVETWRNSTTIGGLPSAGVWTNWLTVMETAPSRFLHRLGHGPRTTAPGCKGLGRIAV